MDLHQIKDMFTHVDVYLEQFTSTYGTGVYAILAAIIFAETGLVVMAILPGDSLLFACGAFAVRPGSGLSILTMGAILIAAAILGDTVNYHVGKAIGPRVMRSEKSRFFDKKHLARTHTFFEKYGGKAIILARFVPIVRTFAPFVAGAGAMNYGKFISYNVVGAVLWVGLMMGSGVAFGNIGFVRKHFDLVVVSIVLISVLPMVFEYLKSRSAAKEAATAPKTDA